LEKKELLLAMMIPFFLFSFSVLGIPTPQEIHVQSLIAESLRQREAVLETPEFQNIVATLQTQMPVQIHKNKPSTLTLFVSFSLGEKALLNLAHEAKRWNANLVLRGFIDGSYAKTVKALQKIILETGQGVSIDPELFSLFNIKAVPTYVLSKPFQLNAQERTQTPLHDRIQGHVSLQYALEQFAKTGDLREEAQTLLEQRGIK
jgi:type-F conjugative transfer system pilin assembly protein TrbC